MPRRSADLLNWVVIAPQSGEAGLTCHAVAAVEQATCCRFENASPDAPVQACGEAERVDQATGSAVPQNWIFYVVTQIPTATDVSRSYSF
jgi:hypothetical protein